MGDDSRMTPQPEVREQSPERRMGERAMRVLVADDDRDMVDTLAEVLRDQGYVVHTAYSGGDVLQGIQVFRPDAVILDVNLPKVSGYALAQATRFSFTEIRRPLIIGMSGWWTQAPDRMVGEQVGFDHYLVKPTDPADVISRLEAHRKRS
jgi:DNA-binding response OmpR family regulator